QALPTTFGLRAAGWMVAVDSARSGLERVRDQRLAVQLGGAAGTLASLGDAGLEVARRLAAELGLAEPLLPWHTDRVRVAGGAAAHGRAMLEALRVDPARMRANLGARGGMLMAESVAGRLAPALGRGAAHALVRDRVRSAEERGVGLREVLVNDPAV